MAFFRKLDTGWEYRISYKTPDGRYKEKSKRGFRTKALAQAAAIETERNLNQGLQINKDLSLYDYFIQWSEVHKKPLISARTWLVYENTQKKIKHYFKQTALASVTSTMYQQVLNDYASTHAQETVQRFHIHIKAAVDMAVHEGLIPRNFCSFAKINSPNKGIKQETKFLELEEYQNLIRSTQDNVSYQSHFMIYLIAVTGARFAEALAFTWDDVDPVNKTIEVNKSWDYIHNTGFKEPKTKSSNRKIPLDDRTLALLNQYRENYWKPSPDKRIFGKISNTAVNKTLRKIVGRNVHVHSLRHTYASYLISKGIELISISKLLGHENLTITLEVYAHQLKALEEKSNDEIREIFNNFG